MNYYNRKILPRLLDESMAAPEFTALRRKLLARVSGRVLEIGLGGGHNFACFPPNIRQITVVDVSESMLPSAADRARRAGISVDYHPGGVERMPFAKESFDSVVSTWTLCSVQDVRRALAEINRVLKTGASFYFVEHGLSPDGSVRFWQNRLTPLQKLITGGCHLNRDFPALIKDAGFHITEMQTFYLQKSARPFGYTFFGVAQK